MKPNNVRHASFEIKKIIITADGWPGWRTRVLVGVGGIVWWFWWFHVGYP